MMAFSALDLIIFLASFCWWCAFASLLPNYMAVGMAMAESPPCSSTPQDPQVSALLAFKAALTCYDASNCVLSTWDLPSLALANSTSCLSTNNISHLCTHWVGIACQSDHVIALNLSGCDLGGSISPSLADLPFLRSLDLSHNRLMGRIPTVLGNRSSLTAILLRNNSLQGGIPPELGKLSILQVLGFGSNDLTGVVPAAIGNCTALTVLKLYVNQLSGPIPVELSKLGKLQTLYLWGNRLTGEIPSALGNCTSLTELMLQQNHLSGRIPAELSMLKELRTLGLGSNELTGGIPSTLRNCTYLAVLALENNSLSGGIPVELGMLNEVQLLYLWGNQLTGEIPTALGNCTSLTDLELVRNELSGPIPVELGMLKELNTLYLWSNQLTGKIPGALGDCTSLTDLQLWNNHLSGRIPLDLGMPSCRLQTLSAGSNRFDGIFPSSLANCTALVALSIGSNSLSGAVPDIFNVWSSLGVLDLSDNHFSGALPRSLGSLKTLYKLHLQGNALLGTIPDSFLSSPLLASLDLSSNNLSGPIPESFATAIGLVELRLSRNRLSGQVPPNLGSFSQLVSLDLSWNALSGRIPASLQGALQLQSFNLSHNNITGPLPASFASLQSLLLLNLSYNQLEGPIPNAFPYNSSTKPTLVDLSGNPLLCGEAVNRRCTPTMDRGISQHTKLLVSVASAFCFMGLSIIGIVIIWKQRSKHYRHSNLDIGFRFSAVKVSAEDLRVATNGFSEDCILGQGGSSVVYKVVLAGQDAVPVAIKVLKSGQLLQTMRKAQVARLKREVEVLATVRHRNIVKVLGCCFNLDMQAIILELMPNGNLDTYLHGTSKQTAPSKDAKLGLLHGIAQGLEYLHHWHDPSQSIVHCDVKPTNILLDEDWEPHLADFGIAKLLQHAGSCVQAQQDPATSDLLRGSVGYIPPEYAFNAEVSTAGDVYSFGVVMLELLTGTRPTDVENETGGKHETLMSLVQAAYPENLVPLFTADSSSGIRYEEAQELARMALSCASHHPFQRPTMTQVTRFLRDMIYDPPIQSPLSSLIQ